MEQVGGRDHGATDQTKVLAGRHVLEPELRDDLGVTHGIPTVLVDEGVETLEVVIVHLLPLANFVVQSVGIGVSAKEGVQRVQGLWDAMMLEKLLDARIGGALALPLAFPHGLDKVAVLAKQLMFLLAGTEHVIHGLAQVTRMGLVLMWEASGAPVPEAAVKLVHGMSVGIVAVDGVMASRDGSDFAPVMRVTEGIVEQVSFPAQPFKGRWGLVDATTAQPCRGSQAVVPGSKQWVLRKRLQADAMVICSKGSKPASASNSRLKLRQPSLSRRTSDWQYSKSSFQKSST